MSDAAYRVDGASASAATFYRHACDPQRSVVVEACAGAGKTWMLVSRILRALLDGAQPNEILAITFTRKAAGEMQQRLGEWLREFSILGDTAAGHERLSEELGRRGLSPSEAVAQAPALSALHERVLGSGRTVQAYTFHAWFAQLMRAAPAELLDQAGLQRDMELIETLDGHWPGVWRCFHAAVLSDSGLTDDFQTLSARRGRSGLRSWLAAALERRLEITLAHDAGVLERSVARADEIWPAIVPGAHPAEALLSTRWRKRLQDLALELGRGGSKARRAAQGLSAAVNDSGPAFELVWAALFTQDDEPRKQLGESQALCAVQADLMQLAAQCRQHEAHEDHQRMARLSLALFAQYASYKRERGLADMTDLETCATTLLRDEAIAGWMHERLDARYRHVLIDEFQDTSPQQWLAMHAWLSGYAGAGGGVSGQQAPAVFIVGDPKQSIYRFRRAEPRVFGAAREFVRNGLGGTLLECDHTRRNHPRVLAALNAVFASASAQHEFAGFRTHTTALGAGGAAGLRALPLVGLPERRSSAADGPAATWRDSLRVARREPEELRRAEEAWLVARGIRELIDAEGHRPQDIMVLCRKRQSLRFAAEALHAQQVPHVEAESRSLLDMPVVRDLLALLDALASPGHNLSIAHALRCPLFGISDDDLVELARIVGSGGDWWSALVDHEHASPALQRSAALMRQWASDAAELPPHDLLDRIVHQGEYREHLVAVVPAEQTASALSAVDALLECSLTLDGARYATIYNFVRALRRRNVAVAAPARADAVQLLTIHGAKGLEAKIVFVMDTKPEAAPARTATLLVDWPVDRSAPTRCAFLYAESRCPESLRAPLEAELAAREREELNALYVAMTRARERLIISATMPVRAEARASWWDRLCGHAGHWSPALTVAPQRELLAGVVTLTSLPRLTISAPAAPPAPLHALPAPEPARRLGQAVHRLLEWAADQPQSERRHAWTKMCRDVAREFLVDAAAAGRTALRILDSPECAPFFAPEKLAWSGNEVSVSDGKDVLRIDRLVHLRGDVSPTWWVLDYKLSHAPEELAVYQDQLLRYRDVVARLEAPARVRCAFITGAGRVIELD